jgi:hypothetical protein
MKQLELRTYPRAEIAEALSVNLKDSSHFKRNVQNKLSKWGYSFRYSRAAVEIISKPEAPEGRLSEILYRGYGIDVQVNSIQFACFISAFTDIEDFSSSPWAKREELFYKYYGYCVSERTMRNWCSQLINRGVIMKLGESTAWRTYFENGKKIREPIEEIDKEEMQNYYERRSELFKDNYISELERGKPQKEARAEAWRNTYKDLWAEFQCCFYYCKYFVLSGFSYNDVDVWEIYELSREIAAPASPLPEASAQAQERFVF